MKKKALLFVIFIVVIMSLTSCNKAVNFEQMPNSMDSIDRGTTIDGYKVSESHDGEKEIYCTKDKELILVFSNNQKNIYKNYRNVVENPYSIQDFDEYKIQWSKDSNYVFIIDSIYDLKNDKLIPIENCVIFSWINNKGTYLSDGAYYKISYDGALQNEMFIGKKINIIENGVIKEVSRQLEDRYFVLYEFIDADRLFKTIGDYIIINTASLKYSEEQLQQKIEEDLHDNGFKEFLVKNYNDEVNKRYKEVINILKESKEFQELKSQINNLENNYPIEFECNIKELLDKIDEEAYCNYNVSGKFYLKNVRQEEIYFR